MKIKGVVIVFMVFQSNTKWQPTAKGTS